MLTCVRDLPNYNPVKYFGGCGYKIIDKENPGAKFCFGVFANFFRL